MIYDPAPLIVLYLFYLHILRGKRGECRPLPDFRHKVRSR